MYLLTIYNSYNAGGVYIVETGKDVSSYKCDISQIMGDTTYFNVSSIDRATIQIDAGDAYGYVSWVCIGGLH